MASNITVDTITKGSTTLNTDEIVDTNSSQVCKAWVNFNGTGTVAIRDSFNVSSITDNGTGDYKVNFTSNMTTINYTISGTCHEFDNGSYTSNGYFFGRNHHEVNGASVACFYYNNVKYDMYVDVMIFGA